MPFINEDFLLSTKAARRLYHQFAEDEPIFAAAEVDAEPLHKDPQALHPVAAEPVESATVSATWNRDFRRADEEEAKTPASLWNSEAAAIEEQSLIPEDQESSPFHETETRPVLENAPEHEPMAREEEKPIFAAPGTMEEETIDEEEADTIHYESSSDEGYEEFEEEIQAAGQGRLSDEAREAVAEIHGSALSEGDLTGATEIPATEGTHAEDDSEELALEEAQAEAEAILDAEARGNGTVDARAEVRAPAATAGYTQRTSRPRFDRQDYERRGGRRGVRGNRFGDLALSSLQSGTKNIALALMVSLQVEVFDEFV